MGFVKDLFTSLDLFYSSLFKGDLRFQKKLRIEDKSQMWMWAAEGQGRRERLEWTEVLFKTMFKRHHQCTTAALRLRNSLCYKLKGAWTIFNDLFFDYFVIHTRLKQIMLTFTVTLSSANLMPNEKFFKNEISSVVKVE